MEQNDDLRTSSESDEWEIYQLEEDEQKDIPELPNLEKQIDIYEITNLEKQISFLKNRINLELKPSKEKIDRKINRAKKNEKKALSKANAKLQSEISKLTKQLVFSEKKLETMLNYFSSAEVDDQRRAYNNNTPQPTVILTLPTYHSNYRSLVSPNFFDPELTINFPIDNNNNNNNNNINDNFDTIFLGNYHAHSGTIIGERPKMSNKNYTTYATNFKKFYHIERKVSGEVEFSQDLYTFHHILSTNNIFVDQLNLYIRKGLNNLPNILRYRVELLQHMCSLRSDSICECAMKLFDEYCNKKLNPDLFQLCLDIEKFFPATYKKYELKIDKQFKLLLQEANCSSFRYHWTKCYKTLQKSSNPSLLPSVTTYFPDEWQVDLIHAIEEKKSVIVNAPTSSGKSFVTNHLLSIYREEIKAINVGDKREFNSIIVFVAPTQALCTQMRINIIDCGFEDSKDIAFSTSKVRDNECGRITICTPGMLERFLISKNNEEWVSNLKYVVLDEYKSIDSTFYDDEDEDNNKDNGASYTRIISLLRCPFIVLSATIAEPDSVGEKLSIVHKKEISVIPRKQILKWADHEFSIYSFSKKCIIPVNPYAYAANIIVHSNRTTQTLNNHKVESTNNDNNNIEIKSENIIVLNSESDSDEDKIKEEDEESKFYSGIVVPDDEKRKLTQFQASPKDSAELLDQVNYLNEYEEVHKNLIKLPITRQQIEEIKNDFVSKMTDNQALLRLANQYPNKGEESINSNGKIEYKVDDILNLLNELKKKEFSPALLFYLRKEKLLNLAEELHKCIPNDANIDLQHFRKEKRDEDRVYKSRGPAEYKLAKQQKIDSIRKQFLQVDITRTFHSGTSFKEMMAEEDMNFWISRYYKEQRKKRDFYMYMDLLAYGIGFHHNGVSKKYRDIVEGLFRKGLLPFLFCTSTLALGLDMPCRTSVIFNEGFLSPSTFKQMMGRAGRRGFDVIGNVIFYGFDQSRISKLLFGISTSSQSPMTFDYAMALRLINLQCGNSESGYLYNQMIESFYKSNILKLIKREITEDQHTLQVVEKSALEFLYRLRLINSQGRAIGLAGIVCNCVDIYHGSFALSYIMRTMELEKICAPFNLNRASDDPTNKISCKIELLEVLSPFLFPVRYQKKKVGRNQTNNHKDMPDWLVKHLDDYNNCCREIENKYRDHHNEIYSFIPAIRIRGRDGNVTKFVNYSSIFYQHARKNSDKLGNRGALSLELITKACQMSDSALFVLLEKWESTLRKIRTVWKQLFVVDGVILNDNPVYFALQSLAEDFSEYFYSV